MFLSCILSLPNRRKKKPIFVWRIVLENRRYTLKFSLVFHSHVQQIKYLLHLSLSNSFSVYIQQREPKGNRAFQLQGRCCPAVHGACTAPGLWSLWTGVISKRHRCTSRCPMWIYISAGADQGGSSLRFMAKYLENSVSICPVQIQT